MPANWYIPSSASATLTVGVARGEIGDFRVPPAAELGEIIGSATQPLPIGVRNVGSLAGRINLRIRDLDGAIIWTGTSKILAINEFEFVNASPAYPMPNRDLRLRAEAYHDAIVDSSMDRAIVLIVRVDTAITLTLEPAAIEPGGTYRYVGRLTRVDTGAGLAGMAIIARREGVDIGTGTTGSDGSYDIAVAAPTAVGSFLCMAAFPGVIPFVASSAEARLGVGLVLEPLLWALAALSVGAGLTIAGSM